MKIMYKSAKKNIMSLDKSQILMLRFPIEFCNGMIFAVSYTNNWHDIKNMPNSPIVIPGICTFNIKCFRVEKFRDNYLWIVEGEHKYQNNSSSISLSEAMKDFEERYVLSSEEIEEDLIRSSEDIISSSLKEERSPFVKYKNFLQKMQAHYTVKLMPPATSIFERVYMDLIGFSGIPTASAIATSWRHLKEKGVILIDNF